MELQLPKKNKIIFTANDVVFSHSFLMARTREKRSSALQSFAPFSWSSSVIHYCDSRSLNGGLVQSQNSIIELFNVAYIVFRSMLEESFKKKKNSRMNLASVLLLCVNLAQEHSKASGELIN